MNLPNKLTFFRVCLIPVFLFFYLVQPLRAPISDWLALVLFAIASITDAIDGYVARRYNLVTNFGKLMDPLADKLLVCAALVAFVASNVLPAWAVVLLISREFFVSGLRQLALEQGKVIEASAGGKIKTTTQIVLILFLLLPMSWTNHVVLVTLLLFITLAASIFSAIDYALKVRTEKL